MNVQPAIAMPHGLSAEAFFDWCEYRSERYELVEGSPRLQPWVKRNHSRIASNISFLLQTLLDRDFYDVHLGDFAIATGASTVRYADVLVEPSGGSGQARTADSALLIVEILSPSTEEEDLGRKREEYQTLPSLQSYIVLAQDERRVLFWARQSDGTWPAAPFTQEVGSLRLQALGISLPLDEIYRGVTMS